MTVQESHEASDHWSTDLLARKADAEFLRAFLIGRFEERKRQGLPSCYVLNLNGAWGLGKSFFLERFAKDLRDSECVVAVVNAWRDDHADDPLLSVMGAIDDEIQSDAAIPKVAKAAGRNLAALSGQVVSAVAKGAIKQAATRLIGDEAREVLALVAGQASADDAVKEAATTIGKLWDEQSKALIDKFRGSHRTIKLFRKTLQELVERIQKSKAGPVFVFIDELDRCRPLYAVSLLERVKHFFDVDGVVFVVATDTEQLQHSIGAIYGTGFDSKRYLRRFFDTSYTFEDPSTGRFVAALAAAKPISDEKISYPGDATLVRFIADGVDYCGLTLRDAQQVYDTISNVSLAWNRPHPLVSIVLVPLVIGHVLGLDMSISENFFSDLVAKTSRSRRLRSWNVMFPRDTYESKSHTEGVQQIFAGFVQYIAIPLRELAQKERPTGSKPFGWAYDELQREFDHLRDAPFAIRGAALSRVLSYPSIIRAAGRLSA